jgi:micrococcal nuclease
MRCVPADPMCATSQRDAISWRLVPTSAAAVSWRRFAAVRWCWTAHALVTMIGVMFRAPTPSLFAFSFRACLLLSLFTVSLAAHAAHAQAREATESQQPRPNTETETACEPGPTKRGVVTEVLSATSVRLDDGRMLQLRSVLAPSPTDVVGGAAEWPIAEKARTAVAAWLTGQNVRYRIAGRRPDRYGRFAADLWRADPAKPQTPGDWVQAWMLREGLARFAPFRDRSACADVLATAELAARRRTAGLWALDAYRTHPAWKYRDLARLRNTFQIVEGKVRKVSNVRGRVFINFGRDWRRDFTAAVSKRQLRYFDKAGIVLDTLAGRRVEVRGWITYRGGPYVEIEHTHQLRRIKQSRSPRRRVRAMGSTAADRTEVAPVNPAPSAQ